jgi:hypothetical protein
MSNNAKVPKSRLGFLNIGSADFGTAGIPVSLLSSGSASAGQALIYNGTAYVPTSIPASTTFVDAEIPSGTKNGTNTTFTLAGTPSPAASLQLFVGGLLLSPGTAGDYVLGTATIAFNVAPGVNDAIYAYYRK